MLLAKVQGEQGAFEVPLAEKLFSTGRVGYFGNGKVALGGETYTFQFQMVKQDPTIRRSGEGEANYHARLDALNKKAVKAPSKSNASKVVATSK